VTTRKFGFDDRSAHKPGVATSVIKEDFHSTQPIVPDQERTRPRLAIVVPCFNEELVLPESARRMGAVMRDLKDKGRVATESFLYFVDDGSIDGTWNLLCELNQADRQIKALKLARNFGHQNAVLAGLLTVRNRVDCVISMDADLQHDEHAIYAFLDKYRDGADIVNGIRRTSGSDSLSKKMGTSAFYWLMKSMRTGVLRDHPDYRLVSSRVLEALADYKEVNLFLRGIFANMGFQSEVVDFDVHQRFAGTTHYSWAKMIGLALDGITSFSVVPLRMIAIGGFLITLVALALSVFVVVSAVRGNVVPGWASTVLPIYVLGGLQIMIIGLVAEYIGKIYSEVKQRPRFICEQELN
jgi:glycosyltransferase involved in cell wall biosynthesis